MVMLLTWMIYNLSTELRAALMAAMAMAVVVAKEMAMARMTVRTRMIGSCVTSASPLAGHAAWVVYCKVGAGNSAPSVLVATFTVLLPDITRGSKIWCLKL